jgi:glycosyltransferase involved in cell wall biosynthesis
MAVTSGPTLRETLRRRTNAYDPVQHAFEQRTGHGWHTPTPPHLARGMLSVVIPAHNMSYSLPAVLDAITAQQAGTGFEVIVVDDGSTDGTGELARQHPLRPTVIRTPQRCGAGCARNLGVALAGGETVLFADADIVLPPHALADVAARAGDRIILVGFRHNIGYQADPAGQVLLPSGPADLAADHRVRWHAPAGQRLVYSGITLDKPVDGRPLDATDDLRELGFARTYYDWDLPRMVVTALMAAPREAICEVGGFHPRFGEIGWGSEDTYLGAALIGLGLMVVPLRQLVGYHINPPDEASSWAGKLATWPQTVTFYRNLLDQPPPHGRSAGFRRQSAALLRGCEVTR